MPVFVLNSLHKISFLGCFLPCTTPTSSYPSLFIIRNCSRPHLIILCWFWVQMCAKSKFLIFSPFFLLIKFGWIKIKFENGSCSRLSCVNQHDFKCMYHIPYESMYMHSAITWKQKRIQNPKFIFWPFPDQCHWNRL